MEKEEKEQILNSIKKCKDSILMIMQSLRQIKMGRLQNDTIARLNQLAYSGIWSTAMNKKIAGRVDKNIERFKEGDEKISQFVSKLNIAKLREKHTSLIDDLGNCFMTTNDVIDAIESKDCFCLELDVTWS